MNNLDLDYKVIVYDINRKEPVLFNIFQNSPVYEKTIELLEDYHNNDFSWQEFIEKLDNIIMWQEWSRTEYEIGLCDPLLSYVYADNMKTYKWDAYKQAHANIEIIAHYVYNQYKKIKEV